MPLLLFFFFSGKHSNRPNKYNEEDIANVHKFIDEIPKYQSHYSRTQNPNKMYLDSNLNINALYHDCYLQWCESRNFKSISADKFRRVFCEDYNIGFKFPKSDTCATCDSLTTKIQDLENSDNIESTEYKNLKIQQQLHIKKAEAGQQKIKQLTMEAAENSSKLHVISLDLQQALPTPKLTVSHAFYRRKIWTYNLGIHDCGSNKGYMFLWSENQAKRGSEEIISCLLKYIEIVRPQSEILHIITDNCKGQNKNWNFVAFCNALVNIGRFTEVHHHFPVVGHTQLPCDRDFGRIEIHARNRHPYIYSPSEWARVILTSNRKNPFQVTIMQRNDFKDFSSLATFINKKAKAASGRNIKFSDAACLSFFRTKKNVMFLSYSQNLMNDISEELNLHKRGRNKCSYDLNMPEKYKSDVKLNSKKVNDVISLMPWIPEVHHPFYKSLVGDGNNCCAVEVVDFEDNDIEDVL